MNDLNKLLSAFFGRTLNLTDAEVAELLYSNSDGTELKPDALDNILNKDTLRIQKFKDERQVYHDNGYKKAQKEALTKLENDIKEAFEISSDSKGIDLIQEIVNAKVSTTEGMAEEKVKVHPTYTKAINELNKKIKETEGAWKDKYEAREKDLSKQNAFQGVKSKAKNILESLKPILPSDNTKAEKQLTWFFQELGQFEFDDQEGTILIMKDGKLLEDGHGNRINFDAFIKEKAASIWDFQQGTAKTGTGNGKDGKALPAIVAGQTDLKVPKDKLELSRMISEAKTPEERVAISDAWEKAQATAI